MIKLLFYILLCLCVFGVHAEVYKCTDNTGRTTFSGKPCAEDAEILHIKSNKSNHTNSVPASSLVMADGSIQPFKKIITLEVKTKTGYKKGKDGLYVFHNGTDHIIGFDKLVSLHVLDYDREKCGNSAHLCNPKVLVKTKVTELKADYEALRNIKILIDDKLSGEEKELVVWFATDNKPRIKVIMF